MELLTYAPVVIPTLNRYEHLKKCLDSLGNCTGSEKTIIYISVDYPPHEKYVEGYKKVNGFLASYNFRKFKDCYVFYQKTNLGPFGNSRFLHEKLKKDGWKRYIFTEDDNIFSLNFLEYMNYCLNVFEEDKSTFAICGFSDSTNKERIDNIYKSDAFAAYGCGIWVSKFDDMQTWLTRENLEALLYDKKKRNYLYNVKYKKYWILIRALIEKQNGWSPLFIRKDGGFECIDHIYLIYMEAKSMTCVYPSISKVRNIGCDGSGLHVFENAKYDQVELDTERVFMPKHSWPLEATEEDIIIANSDINSLVNVKRSKLHYRTLCWIYMHINKEFAKWIEDFFQRLCHNIYRIKAKQVSIWQLCKSELPEKFLTRN